MAASGTKSAKAEGEGGLATDAYSELAANDSTYLKTGNQAMTAPHPPAPQGETPRVDVIDASTCKKLGTLFHEALRRGPHYHGGYFELLVPHEMPASALNLQRFPLEDLFSYLVPKRL